MCLWTMSSDQENIVMRGPLQVRTVVSLLVTVLCRQLEQVHSIEEKTETQLVEGSARTSRPHTHFSAVSMASDADLTGPDWSRLQLLGEAGHSSGLCIQPSSFSHCTKGVLGECKMSYQPRIWIY